MEQKKFSVEQIDHIHVFVPDQYEAAVWYQEILGLEILVEHQDWAMSGGPLTISSDGGNTSLALFQRAQSGATSNTIAFRVSGAAFMAFLAGLEERAVFDHSGNRITGDNIVDHDRSFSVYFCDPYGNPYELTTYEYQYVSARLGRLPKDAIG